MNSNRQAPVVIRIHPWFADHRFAGKVVLPAVETMRLLAEAAAELSETIDIRIMKDVRFGKLLEIPGDCDSIAALVEFERIEHDSVRLKLLSRKQLKAVSRLQEHGEILFSPAPVNHFRFSDLDPELTVPDRSIPAEKIYRELIPFGPRFHTLKQTLHLSGRRAWGRLEAAELSAPENAPESIGSPFPLDGAFHAACVLGQRHADFVPFPVGFDRRVIARPTRPGVSFRTRVELLSLTGEELVFDLDICDDAGQVFEKVTGLRMRDVSGGKMKPPVWMKE
jgi:hypothetical protein